MIEQAHALGLKVVPWTVDDPQRISVPTPRSASTLITNYPDRTHARRLRNWGCRHRSADGEDRRELGGGLAGAAHTVKPMSPIPVDPDGPEERPLPEPLGAPHHEAHLPPGVERGRATVRALLDAARQHPHRERHDEFPVVRADLAYLETRSVMATAIIGGAATLFLAVFDGLRSLVDRHRKKPIMVVSSVVTLLAFAPLRRVYVLFGEEGVSQRQQPGFWIFVTVISPVPWSRACATSPCRRPSPCLLRG